MMAGLSRGLGAEGQRRPLPLYVPSQIPRASAGEQSVAVLYRTNAQSRAFEEVLRRDSIDYRVVGGLSFYARAEVKDVLAYARLASNPHDDAAFLRIVNMPPRGIGDTTLGALEALARRRNLTLWEGLEQELAEPHSELLPRALKALEGFFELMRELMGDRGRLPMREFFNKLVERSGYLEMLRSVVSSESQDRIENIQELVNAAAEAEVRGETLAELLDRAALVSDADDYDERARVTLMTVHSAKGLEFSTVFLAGLEEGLLPHKLSLEDGAAIEEERRLCYVGMTRAKDRLILTRARQRRSFGLESFNETLPSRFLKEIPPELLEPLTSSLVASKPRTTWEGAVNSVSSAERFLKQRLRKPSAPGAQGMAYTRSSPHPRWRRGAQVRHPAYGVGTILNCEGEGADTKLTISFPGYGQRKFIEGKAPLEKA